MTQTPTAPRHVFRDRQDAGRVLAGLLHRYRRHPDVVVLALPRGGVPVAYEVAQALGAPLDVFLVRKLGVPGREELAMGAIASGGLMVLNDDVVRGLGLSPEGDPARSPSGRRASCCAARRRTARAVPARRHRPDGDPGRRRAGHRRQHAGRRAGAAPAPAGPDRRRRPGRAGVDLRGSSRPSPTRSSARRRRRPSWPSARSYWDFAQTSDDEVRDAAARPAAASDPAGRDAPGRPVADPRLRPAARRGRRPPTTVLFDLVGDAHLVLIGEASHGTHEFYEARARITRRLIEEKGFRAVAVEADWPDAYRVNRYVRGHSEDETAERGAARVPALPGLDVAQRGRAGLRRLAARAQRRRGRRRPGRLLRARPLQPEPLRRGGPRLPGGGRPGRGRAGPRALLVPGPPHLRRGRGLRLAARRSAPASSASASWSSSWSS